MSATRELYVYWKTSDGRAALAAVRMAQEALCAAEPGLQARVLEREDAAPVTLMEIYVHGRGIDAALQARIERTLRAATRSLAIGARHVEVFHAR